MPFSKVLARSETQTASSGIWTRVTESISNHYRTRLFKYTSRITNMFDWDRNYMLHRWYNIREILEVSLNGTHAHAYIIQHLLNYREKL